VSGLSDDLPGIDWRELAELVEVGRRYAHAPIVEAVLEIQVRLRDGKSLDDMRNLMDGVQNYGQPDKRYHVHAALGSEENPVDTVTRQAVGLAFTRTDGLRVVQAHLDRFIFSWLPPYDTWDQFQDEALACWRLYQRVAEPEYTTRLAVRFVNRIDVPQRFDVMDYVRTGVDVSRYLPQLLNSYFMQIEVPLQSDVSARITSALAPSPAGNASLILDIDAFRFSEIQLGLEEAEHTLRKQLGVLRDAKNYVFESCITDATRELIK